MLDKVVSSRKVAAASLKASKLESAAGVIERGVEETLTYVLFPPEHLEEDTHQQQHRAAEPADRAQDARLGDAGGGEVQVRGRGQLGPQALPRHRPAERMGRQGGCSRSSRASFDYRDGTLAGESAKDY